VNGTFSQETLKIDVQSKTLYATKSSLIGRYRHSSALRQNTMLVVGGETAVPDGQVHFLDVTREQWLDVSVTRVIDQFDFALGQTRLDIQGWGLLKYDWTLETVASAGKAQGTCRVQENAVQCWVSASLIGHVSMRLSSGPRAVSFEWDACSDPDWTPKRSAPSSSCEPRPRLVAVAPSQGNADSLLRIEGRHFDTNPTVLIGQSPCEVRTVSPSLITCKPPPSIPTAPIEVSVLVKDLGLALPVDYGKALFSYVFSLASVSLLDNQNGSLELSINGLGFDPLEMARNSISVNGALCLALQASNTTLVCQLPASALDAQHEDIQISAFYQNEQGSVGKGVYFECFQSRESSKNVFPCHQAGLFSPEEPQWEQQHLSNTVYCIVTAVCFLVPYLAVHSMMLFFCSKLTHQSLTIPSWNLLSE
jgi:hypothetical protein